MKIFLFIPILFILSFNDRFLQKRIVGWVKRESDFFFFFLDDFSFNSMLKKLFLILKEILTVFNKIFLNETYIKWFTIFGCPSSHLKNFHER